MNNSKSLLQLADKLRMIDTNSTKHLLLLLKTDAFGCDANSAVTEVERCLGTVQDAMLLATKVRHENSKDVLLFLIKIKNTTTELLSLARRLRDSAIQGKTWGDLEPAIAYKMLEDASFLGLESTDFKWDLRIISDELEAAGRFAQNIPQPEPTFTSNHLPTEDVVPLAEPSDQKAGENMEDLQITGEFKEAVAAISNDIARNTQKYKQAGKWLNQYFEDDFSWQKILNSSERIISLYFDSDADSSWLLPDEDNRKEKEIKQILQAITAIEFGKFLEPSDMYFNEHEKEVLEKDFRKKQFVELASKLSPFHRCEKCKNKIPQQFKLRLAYKEMLEIKEQCKFLGLEESLQVCLLTWLLANPDANKTAFGITEFAKWEWYSLGKSGVRVQRAEVIRLLHSCEILLDWQNLTYEAWQNIKNSLNDFKQVETVTPELDALGRLAVADFANEERSMMQVGDDKPAAGGVDKPQKEQGKADTLPIDARALALLTKHPEWTTTQIAKELGISRQTLYKYPLFKQTRAVLKSNKNNMPRGSKNGKTGNIDAWDEK